MAQKTYAQVKVGDRFVLARYGLSQPHRTPGQVTMKCRDGITGEIQVRVKLDNVPGEPFVTFPSSLLDFVE